MSAKFLSININSSWYSNFHNFCGKKDKYLMLYIKVNVVLEGYFQGISFLDVYPCQVLCSWSLHAIQLN